MALSGQLLAVQEFPLEDYLVKRGSVMRLVSVIVPTYNPQEHLLSCLASVFSQTYTDYEVIVVDDGSEAGCAPLFAQVKDRYPSLQLLTVRPNRGVAHARNLGAAAAHGEYLAFLDHDDLWDSRKLELQAQFLDSAPECGYVTSRQRYFVSDGVESTPSWVKNCHIGIGLPGFLPGTLLIPRFVLNELQYIADSADGMRRQRGRRGMEVLAELQKLPNILVRISDINVDGVREVDDKLVVLGKQLKSPILTNDYNLNRIAEIQGVTVLNINELANAVKSVVLPGEALRINIIQEGKEHGQGVGYMDDGTMVVVENGREYIGEYMDVNITKVLQTAAGRMIFGRVEEENGRKNKSK